MPSFSSLSPAQQQAFLDTPVMKAPDGELSNLVNPPNGTAAARALFAICLALSTIAVLGSVYVRFVVLKQYKYLGNYLLILSYGVFIATYVTVDRMSEVGMFIHLWDVPWRDFLVYLHNMFISSMLYMFTILPLKVAILLDWLQLFAPVGDRHFVFWAAHITIWVNITFYLSVFVVNQVACTPYEYSWNKLLDGSCTRADTQITNLTSSIFNFLSDVIIFLIPQKVIWKLHLPTRKKIGVSVIFALGLLGCIVALLRLVETVRYATNPDYTYNLSGMTLCSSAELTCGFLVICIPSFPRILSIISDSPLVKKLSSWSSRSKNSSRQSPSSNKDLEKAQPHPGYHGAPTSDRVHADENSFFPRPPVPHLHAKNSVERSLSSVELGIYQGTEFDTVESYDPTGARTQHQYPEAWK